MKTKLLLLSALLVAYIMPSCDARYNELDNAIFIGEAQNSTSKRIAVGEDGTTTDIYASLAAPVQQDVKAFVDVDTTALNAYNKRQGTNYKLLPTDYFSVEDKECLIKAGSVSSSKVNILLNAFDEKLEATEKYAIPLSIKSAEGVNILESSSSIVILCDKIITRKVYHKDSSFDIEYLDEKGDNLTCGLKEFTVEFLILANDFSLNKHILEFKDPDVKKAPFIFSRFGNYDHPVNQFQVNVIKPIYAPTLFDKDKWYHVAITCDTKVKIYLNGVLDVSVDHPEPGAIFNFKKLWIKYQNPGIIADIRLWNRVRTQAEIVNNMYAVNPKSEGLLVYWKIDEGEGDIIHDYTGHGRDVKLPSGGTWKTQQFPPEY